MIYDELENFTFDESQYFTCGELEHSYSEIISKIRDDSRLLPISVIEKLNALNTVLPDNISKQNSKLKSFKDVFSFLSTILIFAKNSIELYHKISPYLIALLKEISKYIK